MMQKFSVALCFLTVLALLVGYPEAADPEGQTFLLRHGTNTVNVVFRGGYAGTPQKANRLLPEITIEPA